MQTGRAVFILLFIIIVGCSQKDETADNNPEDGSTGGSGGSQSDNGSDSGVDPDSGGDSGEQDRSCCNGEIDPGEECDDGCNGDDLDGCSDICTYSCSDDSDCTDDEICNGEERCDSETHTCQPAASQLANGENCGAGLACINGVCTNVSCEGLDDCITECDPTATCDMDTGICQPGKTTETTENGLCDRGNGYCQSGFCVPNTCGDGVQEPNEACDLGDDNGRDGSDCSATCEIVIAEIDPNEKKPINDLSNLIGTSFLLSIEQNQWTEPLTVGRVIGRYVPLFVFEIEDAKEDELDILMGTADNGEQDTCNRTTSFTGVVDPNPEFQIGPSDFEAVIEGEDSIVVATLHDLTITGTFTDQGLSFKENTLSVTCDFRDIYSLFYLVESPTPDRICDIAPLIGFQCESCPHDGEIYCITVKAENFVADAVSGLSVEQIADLADDCIQ